VSPIGECPRPEEFSALIDRELAPEEIPTLERHVSECRPCRELFLRLSAADRMLGLVLRKVNLVQECIDLRSGEKDAVPDALMEQLEELGRHERMKGLKEVELSPVAETGTARRDGAYLVGPGEVRLHRGARLKLSDDARVRFSCLFRWDRPAAHLAAGQFSVLEGTLIVQAGGKRQTMSKGQAAVAGPGGEVTFRDAETTPKPPPAPTPAPTPTPAPRP